MAIEILKATESEFKELVEFVNYVFSHSGEKTDFPSLLPKLYKKEYDTMEKHYVVKEDNKIKAVVGAFPMDLNVLGESLNVIGIGTVSVHPDSRGLGYMKKLMNIALEDMKNEGIDISCLGGQRQRYEYFSYTPCGQQIRFHISNTNIRHKYDKKVKNNIKFEIIDDNNLELIDKCYNLYNKNSFKIVREKSKFLDVLKSWNCNVYAFYKDDEFAGYMAVSEDKCGVNELVIADESDFMKVISAHIITNEIHGINLSLPVWEKNKIKILNEICSSFSVNNSYQFTVLNYEKVLKALLKFKSTYCKLQDGVFKINIKEYGKIAIKIDGQNIEVNKTGEKCDISLEHLEAMQLFFSPLSSYVSEEKNMPECVTSWLPLPLYMNSQDNV